MSLAHRLEGLVAATFAPLRPDATVDLSLVPDLVDALIVDGVTGLYVCGTTGEGESLSAAERCAVAAAYVEAAAGRVAVLIQVGHNSYTQAREMAEHARQIGAAGISALAPSYFKPADVHCLAEHLARIAEGAPDLPFYYYHLPRFTGVDLDMAELLEVATDLIPSLAGIKYSVPDVLGFARCAELRMGRYDLVWGCDEMLLTGLCAGARAAIGSTYNFAAPLYRRILDAHADGDLATATHWQSKAVDMVRVLLRYRALPAIKATMGLIGRPVGPTRLPLRTLNDAEQSALRKDLDHIGFFEWARA